MNFADSLNGLDRRETNRELRALSRLAPHEDFSAGGGGDRFHDGKTKTGAAISRAWILRCEKSIENFRDQLWFYARTFIPNSKFNGVTPLFEDKTYTASGRSEL